MNGGDCYSLMDDLIENGLRKGKDFVCFDADYLFGLMYRYPDKYPLRKNLDLGVDWLKGRYSNKMGDIYVSYINVWESYDSYILTNITQTQTSLMNMGNFIVSPLK